YEQKIIELEHQNENLISENKELKEKWNRRFDDQEVRIDIIKEVASYDEC
ncbi:10375_t:CDS:2, partial [Entrophospora sp. SA101]